MAKIVVTDQYDADVKAFEVQSAWDADIVVCVVDQYDEQGKDELWYFVDNQWDATTKLHWVDSEWDAELKVAFTDSVWDAGWKTNHNLQGRL